jgi:hypothetical protein
MEPTLQEYKQTVLTRFKELEESERATLQGLRGTPEGVRRLSIYARQTTYTHCCTKTWISYTIK